MIVSNPRSLANSANRRSPPPEIRLLPRRFTQKGGSIIVLGHTNKNKSENGRLFVAGTSDVVDGFDCAYITNILDTDHPETRTVQFENIKQRGNVS